jgi:hypothetical protein
MVRYNVERRIFLYEACVKCPAKTCRKLHNKFPGNTVKITRGINELSKKVKSAKSLMNKKVRPHKTTVVHAFEPHDPAHSLDFCNCFVQSVHYGEVGPHLTSFSDEPWFHLHGHVLSQNNRHWMKF